MIDPETVTEERRAARRWDAAAAVVAAGLAGGLVLLGAVSTGPASAESSRVVSVSTGAATHATTTSHADTDPT